MNEGWVKLHRKIIGNKIWDSPVGLKVWLWCLLKASHKESEVLVGFKTVKLLRGQFVFGRLSASEELGISPSTTRNWMSLLKQDSYLDIKTTNKFSVVTINNWNEYQDLDSSLDSKIKTNKKQNNTNNNDKNEKKEININTRKKKHLYVTGEVTDQMCREIAEQYSLSYQDVLKTREKMILYCGSTGNIYADYRLTIMNWLRSAIDKGQLRKISKVVDSVPELVMISEEQRIKNSEKMAEIRNRFPIKTIT